MKLLNVNSVTNESWTASCIVHETKNYGHEVILSVLGI